MPSNNQRPALPAASQRRGGLSQQQIFAIVFLVLTTLLAIASYKMLGGRGQQKQGAKKAVDSNKGNDQNRPRDYYGSYGEYYGQYDNGGYYEGRYRVSYGKRADEREDRQRGEGSGGRYDDDSYNYGYRDGRCNERYEGRYCNGQGNGGGGYHGRNRGYWY